MNESPQQLPKFFSPEIGEERHLTFLDDKELRQLFVLDIHHALAERAIVVKGDKLYIMYPLKEVYCSKHNKDISCQSDANPITQSSAEINSHLCHEEHFNRVDLLPDGSEVTNPFDVISICSFCRLICNDIGDHFQRLHDSIHLIPCKGSVDLQGVEELPIPLLDLLKISDHNSY